MRTLLATAVALLFLPAAAHAAPPPNDARTTPQAVTLPASVTGTTADSTLEADEPPGCAALKGSVWYSLTAADTTGTVVRLQAAGDLDATIDVFQRTRSQLTPVTCQRSDQNGQAELTFKPAKGAAYLVRVGQLSNSVAGTFRLDVFAPQPAPTAPGPPLPAGGAGNTLDGVQDTADAYSMPLSAGVSYRINLALGSPTCVALTIYPPGTRGDFSDARALKRLRCGGYALFTPQAGEGGKYSFLVTATSARGAQPYHLQVARATDDDTSPGLPLANYQHARGALDGAGVDVVDLYRFSLARRSDLKLTLTGHQFGLQLLSDTGRRIGDGDGGELEQQLSPGRYFVAVRADGSESGRYVLERAAREITRTSVSLPKRVLPGQTVRITTKVKTNASGPVQLTIQRFDPLAGWQFFRQVSVTASAGTAVYDFLPPSQGRWRATAQFLGTRTDAPSSAGFGEVLVAPPLGTG